MPWRFEHLIDYEYYPLGDEFISDPANPESIVAKPGQATYLLLSHGQDVFGSSIYGLPPGWSGRLRDEITASGRWSRVFSEKDAEVWKLTKSSAQAAAEKAAAQAAAEKSAEQQAADRQNAVPNSAKGTP